MLETKKNPLAASSMQVERIYITRGDNTYNQRGATDDKAVGLVFEEDIYWLKSKRGGVAGISDVSKELEALNVLALGNDRWGIMDETGNASLKTTTRIPTNHEEVFENDSKYMQRTIRRRDGSIWWTAEELANKFFKHH